MQTFVRRLFVFAVGGAIVATAATVALGGGASPSPGVRTERPSAAPASPVGEEVAFWQARVAADPGDLTSRTQLAASLLSWATAQHDTARAIEADEEIDRVLAARPDDPSALLVKAGTRMFVHDFEAARDLAGRVLARDPTHKAALAIVGDAAFELGDLDAAREYYGTLADRIGAAPEVSARRARLAHASGDTATAIAAAEQAIIEAGAAGYQPVDAVYYRVLYAELLRGAGRYAEASAVFRDVLAVVPEHGPAIEGQAKASAALGDLDDSQRWWERSGELIGTPDFHVLAALGDIAHARGDDEAARRLWHDALAAVDALPAEAQVGFRRDVARFLATRGLDAERALDLARADLAARRDALAYDTLAWAQLAAGDPHAALVSIERALAPGVEDASIWYHAAEIYAANGDGPGAADAVRRALAFSPEFDLYEAPRARALLAGRSASTVR